MLFPYTYVPHQMEKMQEFINFIFYEVWCKGPIGLEFTLDLFTGKPDLREVLSTFGFSSNAPIRGKQFYKEIKEIYALFEPLDPDQLSQFKEWYKANNEIEKVCNNDPAMQLARYEDISVHYEELAKQLGSFFKGLYSKDLLTLADLKAKIGNIDDHYNNAFIKHNKSGKCPFCGISDMKGADHSYREAYDHYLPKARYPFNSINFHNLAPACHECNSTYKNVKDPVRIGPDRRKAFYPYAIAPPNIDIQIELLHPDISRLEKEDIRVKFGPVALNEQIETWKDVYGIEERYKAKLCGDNDGRYWFSQVFDECKEIGLQPEDYLKVKSFQAQKNPYADCNFLRQPFLDSCQKLGLFEVLP